MKNRNISPLFALCMLATPLASHTAEACPSPPESTASIYDKTEYNNCIFDQLPKLDKHLITSATHGLTYDVYADLIAGADVHAMDDAALRESTGWRDTTDAVQALLDAGADVHAHNDEALGYAAGNNSNANLALLLANNAGGRDEALVLAVTRKYPDTVGILLDNGADGHKAMSIAVENAREAKRFAGIDGKDVELAPEMVIFRLLQHHAGRKSVPTPSSAPG